MADSDVRHPIIVDTDAVISVANTSLWPRIKETLTVTTTNVCIQELEAHVRANSAYASDGSRAKWLHEGSKKGLVPFQDESNSGFTTVLSVPKPHGEDAGEKSVETEVVNNPGRYRFAILMDKHGRRSINRVFDDTPHSGTAVAPTFLLYLLYQNQACTKQEFCEACGDLLEGEGWTGYQAVQAAWDAIPIDCSQFLPADLLP